MASTDEIVARLNIEQFFHSYGVEAKKKRGDQRSESPCPFCRDPKHFGYNVRTGLWKCHKCNESGNLVTFYSKMENCPSGQAFKELLQLAGIETKPAQPKAEHKGQKKTKSASEDKGPQPLPKFNPLTTRIYTRLVELAPLTDLHRKQLKDKRGFTNRTIDTLHFRSGGPHMAGIITKLREEFADKDLLSSGLLVEANGHTQPNDQLLDDRVLIPYLDEKGATYHIRPHKLGFEGIPVQPYARLFLKEQPEHIVLTEGEFKAAALWQWGISAIAIPGVSSFGSKHFDRLVELLREFQVKQVTVIFDNEIKDKPDLPNFKPKVEDRYDTPLWAYIMAYKLGREGLATRVGVLPDEWRENGKIDFDGAMAQGRSKGEILAVIGKALAPAQYLDSLSDEAQRIVRRKIARHFQRQGPIQREFNKYVARRVKGKDVFEETISNFVINIKSSFFTPDGVVRNVQLVNEFGEVSETFPLQPSDMAGLNEFKKFCFSKGNYVFEGSTGDLTDIWKLEFSRDMGELIYMPDRIGLIEDDLWLFGNMAIQDGKVYRMDNDGIVWVNGKGYKPQSLQIGPRGESMEDAIPALHDGRVDIKEIAERLKSAVGGYEAYIGIGWVIATIFSKDIFEKYKCMPILFPHGKRESGKSTFMRWLMAFFGVETEGVGIAETTQNFIARALSYYSSLGCWFDEYRNEPRVIQKDGFFRSAYNRQLSGKGTATAFQARGFSVHAGLAISGEELPQDNGLYTRLVPVQISAFRRDRTWFDWLNRQSTNFSAFTYHLVRNYRQYRDTILQHIADLKDALIEMDVSDRTAENWAICAGAFTAVILEDPAEDPEFIKWVEESCQQIRRSSEAEHMLNQFWEDVNILVSDGEINDKHIKVENEYLYIWFPSLYNIWAKYYRQRSGREPFDRMSILKYIQDEPYYDKDESNVVRRLSGASRRIHAINLSKATDTIREIADSLETKSTNIPNYG